MENKLTFHEAPSIMPGTYLVTDKLLLLLGYSLMFIFMSAFRDKSLLNNGKTMMIRIDFQLQKIGEIF